MASPPPGGVGIAPDKGPSLCFTAALAYGLYLCTLVFTVRWLLFVDEGWKWRRPINWPMILVTFFIFLSTTAYTALDVKGAEDAVRFIMAQPGEVYDSPMWMNISKCFFANSVALAADWVLIYRCYVVYASLLRIVIFPIVLWISGFACTILQMYLQIAHEHNPNLGPYKWANVNMRIGPGIVLIPFWGTTTVLNLYCTIMLFARIYSASERSEISTSIKQFRFIARGIAESGFIYLSITIAHFVVWFTYDNLALMVISVLVSVNTINQFRGVGPIPRQNVPLIGIAFNLILIRAALSRIEGGKYEQDTIDIGSIGFGTNPSTTIDYESRPGSKGFESESRSTES